MTSCLNYYITKDSNSFWLAWNGRFSRRSLAPSNINGYCQDDETAEIFRSSFSYAQFDSYTKVDQVEYCTQSVKHLISVEQCDNFNKYDSLFDVEDIEKGLSALKFNKAGGVDGLTKESISYCHPALLVQSKITVQCDTSAWLCT